MEGEKNITAVRQPTFNFSSLLAKGKLQVHKFIGSLIYIKYKIKLSEKIAFISKDIIIMPFVKLSFFYHFYQMIPILSHWAFVDGIYVRVIFFFYILVFFLHITEIYYKTNGTFLWIWLFQNLSSKLLFNLIFNE